MLDQRLQQLHVMLDALLKLEEQLHNGQHVMYGLANKKVLLLVQMGIQQPFKEMVVQSFFVYLLSDSIQRQKKIKLYNS